MIRRPRPPAEVLAQLVGQLVDEVATSETVVARARGGILAHRTLQPGLLEQLRAVSARPAGGRLVRVTLLDRKDRPRRDPVQDERGRQLIRPRWKWHDPDDHSKGGQTVDTPITQPVTRLRRSREPGPGSVVPGAAVPGISAGWDADGALSPIRAGAASSRPPVTEATWLLLDIEQGARRLYAEVLEAAGGPRTRHGLAEILRHLVGLALTVDARTAARAAAAVESWVSAARLVTGYDAPIVRLRDIGCTACRGPLHVRSDASGDIWCSGLRIFHGPALPGEPWPLRYPCETTYPRATWPDLLANDTQTKRTRHKIRTASPGRLEGHGGRP